MVWGDKDRRGRTSLALCSPGTRLTESPFSRRGPGNGVSFLGLSFEICKMGVTKLHLRRSESSVRCHLGSTWHPRPGTEWLEMLRGAHGACLGGSPVTGTGEAGGFVISLQTSSSTSPRPCQTHRSCESPKDPCPAYDSVQTTTSPWLSCCRSLDTQPGPTAGSLGRQVSPQIFLWLKCGPVSLGMRIPAHAPYRLNMSPFVVRIKQSSLHTCGFHTLRFN